MLTTILLIAAFACFVAAAFGVAARVGLGWLGLACWVLAELLGRFP